jgi:hypothetical protein
MVRNRSCPAVSQICSGYKGSKRGPTNASAPASYLKFDSFAVELDVLYLEIDADCGDESWRERVVRISQEETSFSNTYGKTQRWRSASNLKINIAATSAS